MSGMYLVNEATGDCRFPKLEECAHFHYEKVTLTPIRFVIQPVEHPRLYRNDSPRLSDRSNTLTIEVVTESGRSWLIERTWDNFVSLDKQLHQCIVDRKVSQLCDLQCLRNPQKEVLKEYLEGLSAIVNNSLNCAPILNWFQLDNRGRRLLVSNQAINTPAVAAAYSIRRYDAQDNDEISLDVGDVISVIDMAALGESEWWRGKRGFQVGFFPQRCVHIIGDKVPRNVSLQLAPAPTSMVSIQHKECSTRNVTIPTTPIKPVLKKHGKLIALFRSFILSRPARQCLKERGILKERVFGCDLGEHLLNSAQEVPKILKCCTQFIEAHGIVDGIYRLSGISSNIQRLRHVFDEDRIPNLYQPDIVQDIHCVASLLKMYFRELPNPLCTYQLYGQFINSVEGYNSGSVSAKNSVILKMRETVQKLPPPHYRTLEYLMRHLNRVASRGHQTGMTCRNIAIVWAPNLLRSEELLADHLGIAVLQGVGVQAVVTEFLVSFTDLIFNDNFDELCEPNSTKEICPASPMRFRPKSLAIMNTTPTKLLSLREAQQYNFNKNESTILDNYKTLIDVGECASLPPTTYHTVINVSLPPKRASNKKSSSVSSWKSFFIKNSTSSPHRRKKNVSPSNSLGKKSAAFDLIEKKNQLRPVKSVEALSQKKSVAVGTQTTLSIFQKHPQRVSHNSYFGNLEPVVKIEVGSLTDLDVEFDRDLLDGNREMHNLSDDDSFISSPTIMKSSNLSLIKISDRHCIPDDTVTIKKSKLEDQILNFSFIDSNVTTPESDKDTKSKFLNRLSLNFEKIHDFRDRNTELRLLKKSMTDCNLALNNSFHHKSIPSIHSTPTTSISSLKYETLNDDENKRSSTIYENSGSEKSNSVSVDPEDVIVPTTQADLPPREAWQPKRKSSTTPIAIDGLNATNKDDVNHVYQQVKHFRKSIIELNEMISENKDENLVDKMCSNTNYKVKLLKTRFEPSVCEDKMQLNRDRIEKYKEERRHYFREKFKNCDQVFGKETRDDDEPCNDK